MKRPEHPSGRPIKQPEKARGRPHYNVPDDGYVTPRLRKQEQRTNAMGFMARLTEDSDDRQV